MRAERDSEVYEAMRGPNEWTMSGALAAGTSAPGSRELTLPTLILRGAHDISTPAIAKTLTDGIPHAREVVFTRARTRRCSRRPSATRAVQAFLYAVEAR